MKVSFLLPTLFPSLAERMISSIRRGGYPDYEIVVCSPFPVNSERVIWSEDKDQLGGDPALRQAFNASTGDIIMAAPDDHYLGDGAIAKAVKEFKQHPEDLWDLRSDWTPRAFGRLFAPYPMCHRQLVLEAWQFFYPYIQHCGDIAFSMQAWRMGRTVRQVSERLLFMGDRMGYGEASGKTSNFNYRFGVCRLFQDFPEYSRGWSRDNTDWNR